MKDRVPPDSATEVVAGRRVGPSDIAVEPDGGEAGDIRGAARIVDPVRDQELPTVPCDVLGARADAGRRDPDRRARGPAVGPTRRARGAVARAVRRPAARNAGDREEGGDRRPAGPIGCGGNETCSCARDCRATPKTTNAMKAGTTVRRTIDD